MVCPVCNSNNAVLVYKDFTGYIENTSFDIFECKTCNSQYIPPNAVDTNIYQDIYSCDSIPGYDRYYEYAKEIIKQRDPIKYLETKESAYFHISNVLKDRKNLEILDIGCGLGYFTYALNKAGHKATGIDVSEKAISFAQTHFDNHYLVGDINNIATNQRYDIVIASEIIEHLPNPKEFINKAMALLKDKGQLYVMTPNRDYFSKNAIWQSDLPPIHTMWFSKKGIELMLNNMGLKYMFLDYSQAMPENENEFIQYLITRFKKYSKLPVMNFSKKVFTGRERSIKSSLKNVFLKAALLKPFRYIGHYLAMLLTKENMNICICIWK